MLTFSKSGLFTIIIMTISGMPIMSTMSPNLRQATPTATFRCPPTKETSSSPDPLPTSTVFKYPPCKVIVDVPTPPIRRNVRELLPREILSHDVPPLDALGIAEEWKTRYYDPVTTNPRTTTVTTAAVSRPLRSPLPYYIVEELPANTVVGSIAIDAQLVNRYDKRTLDRLQFSFLSQRNIESDPVQMFEIEQRSGIIATSVQIDRDHLCSGRVTCPVFLDVLVGPSEFLQVIKVSVDILDINDHAPQFLLPATMSQRTSNQLYVHISEGSPVGTEISLPSAADRDSVQYGLRRYELVPETGAKDLFKLVLDPDWNADTSDFMRLMDYDVRLRLLRSLDREMVEEYRIQLIAYDGGDPPLSGSLLIIVQVDDENDHAPQFEFSSYELSVLENAPITTTLGTLRAFDLDSGQNSMVRYRWSHKSRIAHGEVFSLDDVTGEVSVRSALDFETQSVYYMTATAIDGASSPQSSHVVVRIDVRDANDNAPSISINIDLANIGIDGGHGSSSDGRTGNAGARKDKAGQQNSSSDNVVGTVDERRRLEDAERNEGGIRKNWRGGETRVSELVPRDTFVCHVSVSDRDQGDNAQVSCRLDEDEVTSVTDDVIKTSIESSPPSFHMTRMTHQLSGGVQFKVVTVAMLDYERQREHHLVITCVDSGHVSRTTLTRFVVKVTDENDNPPRFASDSYRVNVCSNNHVNQVILTVGATDVDSSLNSQIRYSLPDDGAHSRLFTIDPVKGVVRARVRFQGSRSDRRDGSTAERQKDQKEKNGDVSLGQLDSHLHHEEVSRLHRKKGRRHRRNAKVARPEDTDQEPDRMSEGAYRTSFIFNVIAHDLGTPSLTSTAVVHVTIVDEKLDEGGCSIQEINEKKQQPSSRQSQFKFTTYENQPIGTLVGRVQIGLRSTTNDEIRGNKLTQDKKSGSELSADSGNAKSNGNELLRTDFPSVIFHGFPAREQNRSFHGPVTTPGLDTSASNRALHALEKNRRVATPTPNHSSHNTERGLQISKPSRDFASREVESQGTYSLLDDGDDSKLFRIEPLTGHIYTLAVLDRETQATLHLTVMLTSVKVGETAAQATIYDANDYGVTTSSSSINPSPVTSLHGNYAGAEDNDDDVVMSTSVIIYVADVNDNAPVFLWPAVDNNTISVYRSVLWSNNLGGIVTGVEQKGVGEDAKREFLLGTVRAVDTDAGANGRLVYSLAAENKEDDVMFEVDSFTGALTISQRAASITPKTLTTPGSGDHGSTLQLRLQRTHRLLITVRDRGNPPISSSSTLYVTVIEQTQRLLQSDDVIVGESIAIVFSTLIGCVVVILLLVLAVAYQLTKQRQELISRHHDDYSTMKRLRMTLRTASCSNQGSLTAVNAITDELDKSVVIATTSSSRDSLNRHVRSSSTGDVNAWYNASQSPAGKLCSVGGTRELCEKYFERRSRRPEDGDDDDYDVDEVRHVISVTA